MTDQPRPQTNLPPAPPQGYPPQPGMSTQVGSQYVQGGLPSQLGVRPAPALVQQLLIGAFGWMFAGLLLTAAVAYLVNQNPSWVASIGSAWWLLAIGQIALVVVITASIRRLSPTLSLLLFFVYAATMGITIGVIVSFYTTASVASAFFASAAMFGAAALYGFATKRDLTKLGGLLFMGLIGIIVASVVNIFLASGTVSLVIAYVGVALFVGLTAWDVQRISRGDLAVMAGSPERGSILAALSLYLDFINLFLFLLRIFGSGRS